MKLCRCYSVNLSHVNKIQSVEINQSEVSSYGSKMEITVETCVLWKNHTLFKNMFALFIFSCLFYCCNMILNMALLWIGITAVDLSCTETMRLLGWWYTGWYCCQRATRWDTGPTTDLNYPDRNLETLLKMLPCVSSALGCGSDIVTHCGH